jgi:hypothetical protein
MEKIMGLLRISRDKRFECYAICMVCMLFFIVFYTNIALAKVTVGTSSYSAIREYIESEITDFDISIEIPVISGMANEQFQTEINASFENNVRDFVEGIMSDYMLFLEDAEEYGFPVPPFTVYVEFEVALNTDEFLSLYLSYYSFTGGAHGMSFIETYNIDLETGELIELKDLFLNGVDYKTPINEEVKRSMAKESERYFSDVFTTVSITDNQLFCLTDEGIIVYFGLYEIAPYSSGMPEFLITYDKIKTLLKEDYNFLLSLNG